MLYLAVLLSMMDYGGMGTGKKIAKFLIRNNEFIDCYATYSSGYTGPLMGFYWGGDL